MCGIIAVLRRPSGRTAPAPDDLLARVDSAVRLLGEGHDAAALRDAAFHLDGVNRDLAGLPGVKALLGSPDLPARLAGAGAECARLVTAIEDRLDSGDLALSGKELEEVNAAVVLLKDAVWAITRDRLRNAAAVADLAGPSPSDAALAVCTSVQTALSSIDRLEVRGRDSAGLHLLVTGHGLDLTGTGPWAARQADPLFTSNAVRTPGGALSFVYKAAAEIGELGDNTRVLRQAITGDELLHRALEADTAEAVVLGHTRWASVGIISEANAHPLNSDEAGRAGNPYVVAALNGDVDNYVELREREGLRIPPEVTTDAKVIPTLVSRQMAGGQVLEEAFRRTVAEFDGSVAIAASAADAPARLLLALRGSGQALYVGLAEDAFVVASEPYGLVEETASYVRMDGESTRGQVLVLDQSGAGTTDGITRLAYDGTALPLADHDVHRAEITTRDIDRAGFAHFLLKEISEAPQSFRKTLRGKVVDRDGLLHVALGDETLPPAVRARLEDGSIRRVYVVGQGTAAVAGQSMASTLAALTDLRVESLPATELSGFGLDDDMSDTLVVAISQSGTTTDTNRTVDLVRARGAAVIGIVNRRNSDLVEKADGVLYTSDGRDVEMSVASTKAFYAQIAAGTLLALAIARPPARTEHDLLAALRQLPAAMESVIAGREAVAAAARLAPSRRYWAIVGNGPNRVAASEIRIKLSELCYKAIACDATEDKKHIDLSSEPLILVCAAGLDEATAGDVAKEVAIYRAHKAAPVVIASEGDGHFAAALAVITVPDVHPRLAFVLSAMAGHLFGYEAALAIDAQARLFREARAVVEELADADADPDHQLARLRAEIGPAAARIFDALRSGELNGHLEASTAERVSSLLRYTAGIVPLEAYQVEYGKVGTPNVLLADLTDALTGAIEELTRPIDAIKHQAKTVTVGISRSEEAMFRVPLVEGVLAAGTSRDLLTYKALRSLAALDAAVEAVTGYTRYRIDGNAIAVVDQGGVAQGIRSRTSENPELRGTKHRAAYEREVTVARGRSDGRTVVLVPEVKANEVVGLSLLHVRFAGTLSAEDVRAVLIGYRNRYAALVDAVTETEPRFDDARLEQVPLIDLLVDPVHVLADRWRS